MASAGENELAFTQNENSRLVGTLNSEPRAKVSEASPILAAAAADTGQAEFLEHRVQALVDGISGYTPATAGVMTTPMTMGDEKQNNITVAGQNDFA